MKMIGFTQSSYPAFLQPSDEDYVDDYEDETEDDFDGEQE